MQLSPEAAAASREYWRNARKRRRQAQQTPAAEAVSPERIQEEQPAQELTREERRRAYKRAWAKKNAEHVTAYRRKWTEQHRDKLREQMKRNEAAFFERLAAAAAADQDREAGAH